jgi:hypothetical protein
MEIQMCDAPDRDARVERMKKLLQAELAYLPARVEIEKTIRKTPGTDI